MPEKNRSFKVLLVKKKWWSAALCLCLAACMLYVVNYPPAVGAAASSRQLPIYCVQRDQKMLSISFDAAWGNEDTQQLIDILGRYRVKATFFVVGDWVDRYPESVKALHEAGHEIMNHSNSHAHLPQLSAQQITDDLNACNDKIQAVTGVRPTLIRLPYGDYDDNSIRTIRAMGMEPIQWDVEPLATASNGSKQHRAAPKPRATRCFVCYLSPRVNPSRGIPAPTLAASPCFLMARCPAALPEDVVGLFVLHPNRRSICSGLSAYSSAVSRVILPLRYKSRMD